MNVDIIIPVCAPTRPLMLIASTALRTCAAHTNANVIIAGNNIPDRDLAKELESLSGDLGFKWVYHHGVPNNRNHPLLKESFNIAEVFNHHINLTSNPYYACFGQDVIFYPNWLENLIELWKENPQYTVLSPYSFNLWREPEIQKLIKAPRREICHMWPHCTAGLVFRRDQLFLWDEKIPYEADSDLYQYLNHHKLKSGIVFNSRVDHLGQAVLGESAGWASVVAGLPNTGGLLATKWNL